MNTSYSITSKYQVTIPKEVRENIGLGKDDKISFVKEGSKFYLERAITLEELSARMHKRYGSKRKNPATDKEINQAWEKSVKAGEQW